MGWRGPIEFALSLKLGIHKGYSPPVWMQRQSGGSSTPTVKQNFS